MSSGTRSGLAGSSQRSAWRGAGSRVGAAGASARGSSRRETGDAVALRPTPCVTRFTSRARRASARRPAARFTGMSADSISVAKARSPPVERRRDVAVSAGVVEPPASSSLARRLRAEASASCAEGSARRARTTATLPSSPMKTERGSTAPPIGSAPSATSNTR